VITSQKCVERPPAGAADKENAAAAAAAHVVYLEVSIT